MKSPTDVVVRFLGAAGGIGGSMLALEAGGKRILLDCGRPIRTRRNLEHDFPVEPTSVDAIVISHAHQDHAGWLVNFFEAGFGGPIIATAATRDLIGVQAAETARRDRKYHRASSIARTGAARSRQWRPEELLSRFQVLDYGQTIELDQGPTIALRQAGHLLGAAGVLAEWHGLTAYFTGDLGRDDSPIYPPPSNLPVADAVISESTYGDRTIESFEVAAKRLMQLIEQTIAGGGRVIIPAFSLGRMQLILLAIAMCNHSLKDLPIIVDSPTARAFAEVHRTHRGELKEEKIDEAWFGDNITYIEGDDDSIDCAEQSSPAVVLVAGGMADSFRAKRHLRAHIDDPSCRVILVSFQAPETLGWRLLQPGPTVRIDGRNCNKWAEVVQLGGFSGHADRDELLRLLTHLGRCGSAIRLVHGEPPAATALAQALCDAGCADVAAPVIGDVHRLSSRAAVG